MTTGRGRRSGGKIAFVSYRAGHGAEIWKMDAGGTNPVNLTNGTGGDFPAWSPRP